MHNQIAAALVRGTAAAFQGCNPLPKVEVHWECRVDHIWGLLVPLDIADFIPDSAIQVMEPPDFKRHNHIIIVEIARCYTAGLSDLEASV